MPTSGQTSRPVTRQPVLDDPTPETPEKVLQELEYWQGRQQAVGPNGKDAASVQNRILRLHAEMGEFDTVPPAG